MMYCCKPDCTDKPTVEIWNTTSGADPYDYTHSCNAHIGDLLGSINQVEATEWHMRSLSEEEVTTGVAA